MSDPTKHLPWRVEHDPGERSYSIFDSEGIEITWFEYHENGENRQEVEALARMVAAGSECEMLREAIKKHHDQRADDRCFLDDIELYAAAGLDPADVRVGDKDAMLANCARFLSQRCESGGPWKSYAELEAEAVTLRRVVGELYAALRVALRQFDYDCGVIEIIRDLDQRPEDQMELKHLSESREQIRAALASAAPFYAPKQEK